METYTNRTWWSKVMIKAKQRALRQRVEEGVVQLGESHPLILSLLLFVGLPIGVMLCLGIAAAALSLLFLPFLL